MHQRIFKVVTDLAGEEIYSRVLLRRIDARNTAKYQLRRRPATNWVANQVVVPPMPDSEQNDRAHRVWADWWEREAIWTTQRRRMYPNQLLPVAIVELPEGVQQPGIRDRTQMLHARNQTAYALSRRLARPTNPLTAMYPQAAWGVALHELLTEIEDHMLETSTAVSAKTVSYETFYDGLWTFSEILGYFEQRINDFLLRTGVWRQTASQSVGTDARVIRPSAYNHIRRAIWTASDSTTHPLELGDMQKADEGDPGWESSSGTPERLLMWGRGEWELHPKPSAAGTLLLDYVPSFTFAANVTAANDVAFWKSAYVYVLPIPANLAPYIKWGVMADMLSKEGEMHDETRASYCDERYEEGIEVAKMWMGRTD